MIAQTKPLNTINAEAMNALSHEIGASDMIRFLNQFTTGFGDYTKERGKMFDKMELDQVITEIKAMKNPENPAEKE